jgi:hypothetical protein
VVVRRTLALARRSLRSTRPVRRSKNPTQAHWRQQRRDDDHEDERRERGLRQQGLPVERERGPDAREDEPHLAARDHADTHGEPVDTPPDHAGRACELASHRHEHQHAPEGDAIRRDEAAEVHLNAHEDEEERDEQARQGVEEFGQRGFLSSCPDAFPVGVEEQSRGEGADDAGQPQVAPRQTPT